MQWFPGGTCLRGEKGMPCKPATVRAAVCSCPHRPNATRVKKFRKITPLVPLSPGRLRGRNESEDLPRIGFSHTPFTGAQLREDAASPKVPPIKVSL